MLAAGRACQRSKNRWNRTGHTHGRHGVGDRASVGSGAVGALTEVHPLGSATEPIAVDIVTPEEAAIATPAEAEADKPKPEPPQQDKPEPQLTLPDPSALTQTAACGGSPGTRRAEAGQRVAASGQGAAGKARSGHARRSCAAGTGRASRRRPRRRLRSASPGYRPPEPDLTVKYNVMLGLPMDAPPPAKAGQVRGRF